MNLKLPEKYDREELETVINEIITELSSRADNANVLDDITSADTFPQNVREKQPLIHAPDGDTREIIIRDQGQTWKIDMTKV